MLKICTKGKCTKQNTMESPSSILPSLVHFYSGPFSKKRFPTSSLRSVNVFGNVAPFKCIVCFARFISSDLLRIHTATHTGKELLDRCIDFSTTMVDHDKDEKNEDTKNEITEEKIKENSGKPPFSLTTSFEKLANKFMDFHFYENLIIV